ncbi:aprataxin and PNK-like factor isoform 2-T3 [Anableps anableps]
MSGLGLVPVDGGDLVQLPPGETVLGRGPFLGISDTRVSRHHGLLENLDGQLRLKPTHVNPCFVLSSLNDDPRPLEKGCWHRLHAGDLFSLLPGRFVYRVEAVGGEESAPRNSQSLEEEGDVPVPARPEVEQTPGPNGNQPSRGVRQDDSTQIDEAPPPPRRRVLPAWMMAAAAAPRTPPDTSKVHSGVKRSKPAAASSATKATPTLSALPVGAELREKEEERPRKKSRKMSSEEEALPTETDVLSDVSTSRFQTTPSRSGVSSDHPSMDLEDEGKGEGSSQTSEARKPQKEISRSGDRTPCPYGKDCYRKNPLHFQESSHPGDSDYEEEEEEETDRPECPYGTDCYRKNPLHRKEFKHSKKPGSDQCHSSFS